MARYGKDHKLGTRRRIIEAAGRRLKRDGIDGSGVAALMADAGLTNGAFYGHFASKDNLATEITARVVGREGWLERWTGKRDPSITKFVRSYLSAWHRDDPGHGCPVATLGADVARQPSSVRRAFTEGFRLRVETLRKLMPGRSGAAQRQQALATLAGLVGAMVLARAVDDPTLSDEILEAATTSLSRRHK
jgi:TetR/AcrR family transcriptional repressor of nem operon